MRVLFAGAILILGVTIGGITPAQAQKDDNYVACSFDGVEWKAVGGQNSPSHRLDAGAIDRMKEHCVRELLYGGQAFGYYDNPITAEQMRRARFLVVNERGD